jgi:hypothetical protein
VQHTEEALCDLGHEIDIEDQANNFLHCCLILLSDSDAVKKLKQMLVTCMGKDLIERTISYPLIEREVCHVSKKNALVESSK